MKIVNQLSDKNYEVDLILFLNSPFQTFKDFN